MAKNNFIETDKSFQFVIFLLLSVNWRRGMRPTKYFVLKNTTRIKGIQNNKRYLNTEVVRSIRVNA